MDEQMRDALGGDLSGTRIWSLLSRPRTLQRTPQWVDVSKIIGGPMSKRTTNVLVKPLFELYFELERRTEKIISEGGGQKVPSGKIKTRGQTTNGHLEQDQPIPPPPPAQLDIQPTFHLDVRALKVFRTLFYTPSISATPGEIP